MTSEDGSAQIEEIEVRESLVLRIGNWLVKNKEEWKIFPGSYPLGHRAYDPSETWATLGDQDESHPVMLRRRRSISRPVKFFGRWRVWDTHWVVEEIVGIIATATPAAWTLKVYGRDHVHLCEMLARDLQKAFKVKINVRLVEERARDAPA